MGRSTRLAWGLKLRRAITSLLPLFAVCALASPAQAGVRSQAPGVRSQAVGVRSQAPQGVGVRSEAAGEQAIANALSQSTGLGPSQVASERVCDPVRPGFATCDAEALVLRRGHARVRPNVHGGASFTQVFPAGGHGIPSVRPAAAGAGQPEPGSPAWLQQAYDLTFLSQTRGGNDTVAIVDAGDDPTAESDLAVFRSTYGLPACTTASGCFRKVNQTGSASPLPAPDPEWEPEESLDMDAVSALCPNCKILLVEASDASDYSLGEAVAAAANLGANQISNSWSDNEPMAIPGTYSFANAAVIAATGDGGYVGGGYDAYPAAFPTVTAAGGTSLAPAAGGQSARGFAESAWSVDSSGWGASSGCAIGQPKPAYQLVSGCPGRAYSDLSADADPETGLMVYGSAIHGWWQYGGTSLATPLIAAYEAITGVKGTTPQWAYTDSVLLNDPVAGSSGECPPAFPYICDAGPGYDGPTGVGSISGAVVAGAPGIGGPSFGGGIDNTYTEAVAASTATLSGGVYPNGLDTTYYWEYGTTTAYGARTPAVDLGAGQAPVFATAALSGLAPATTYHYRLVAQNADGVTYGYDSQLTTASPPILTADPSTATSAALGPVPATSTASSARPRWTARPKISAARGRVGDTLTITPARWARARVHSKVTRVMRCTSTCVPVGPPNPTRYTITPGDVGAVLWVREVASSRRGSAVVWSSRSVGPVASASSAAVVLSGGRTALRNSRGAALAFATISSRATAVDAASAASSVTAAPAAPGGEAAPARDTSRWLALRRALGVTGPVTAWVCQVTRTAAGSPPRCTSRITVGSRTGVPLPGWTGGAVRVVVVRLGH